MLLSRKKLRPTENFNLAHAIASCKRFSSIKVLASNFFWFSFVGTTEDITSTISSGNDSQSLDSSNQVNKSGEKDDDSDTESDDSDQLQTVNKDSSVSAIDDLPTRTKRTYKKAGKIDFTTEYRKEEKTFEVHILHAYNLAPNRDINEVNPYVKVYLVPGKKQSQTTRWQKATKEPFINENFIFTELTNEDIDKHRLKLRVKNNKIKNEVLGEVEIPLSKKKKKRFKRDLCKKRSEVCAKKFFNYFFISVAIQVLIISKYNIIVSRKYPEKKYCIVDEIYQAQLFLKIPLF